MANSSPDRLDELDPAARKLVLVAALALLAQVSTVVERVLAQCNAERPHPSRKTLQFPYGTWNFALLHSFATDEKALAEVLNQALPEATELRFSVADQALHFKWDDYVALALHPADMDVTNLTEVPPQVRIFKFNTVPPFDIAEAPVYTPERIEQWRVHAHNPLTPLQETWLTERNVIAERLRATVQAERDRQANSLPAQVLEGVDERLTMARGVGYHLVDLLHAAYYLGILSEVTAGFGDDE